MTPIELAPIPACCPRCAGPIVPRRFDRAERHDGALQRGYWTCRDCGRNFGWIREPARKRPVAVPPAPE